MSDGPRAAVFLDRDGTLLDELGYRASPAGMRLLPGAAGAVRRLNQAGLPVVLVTNQSGVARGLFDEDDLARVHAELERLLAREGARLDAVLYCPHLPPSEDAAGSDPVGAGGPQRYRRVCDCRKPAPGLYLRAARELGLDRSRSWAIGDALRDLEAARRAGVGQLVLVATGKGRREHERALAAGLEHAFEPDLAAAVERVLQGR